MSVSIPELEAFIAYQLSQLSARNAHHEFEEIAVRVARRRISANILLPNGPVSAGGDQQRDGESYFTRIPEEVPPNADVGDPLSGESVVIASTTQRDRLKAKVAADVGGICSPNAAPVDRIAFFSVESIPAAAVHTLQREAREKHNVALDVFSGAQIAVLLAEPDLFWIAAHYLDVPNSMAPPTRRDYSPEWYTSSLKRFRTSDGPESLLPGIQGAVARGIRHATFEQEANGDLPEWIMFMRPFLETTRDDGYDDEITFRACYEIAVATLRGLGTLRGVEDLVGRAINYATTTDATEVVSDAVILVSYWGGSWGAGVADIRAEDLDAVVAKLKTHVEDLLQDLDLAEYPVRGASLISLLVRLELVPNAGLVQRAHGAPTRTEIDPVMRQKLDDFDLSDGFRVTPQVFELESAMRHLEQLAELLVRARGFYVGPIADLFQLFAPMLQRFSAYRSVRDALDEAVAQVEGANAKAERCRDRAIAFLEADRPLEALQDLHDAKLAWFNGEGMYGSVLVMRILAETYSKLGLDYAAKLYACTAAALANQSSRRDVRAQAPVALLELMGYMQRAGAWMDAAAIGHVALVARHSLDADPFDYENDDDFVYTEINAGRELSAIRQLCPSLQGQFISYFEFTGWDERVRFIADAAEEQQEAPPTIDQLGEDHSGVILHDTGPVRQIRFSTFGVRWVLEFPNDRSTVLAAESLCAALQVILAELVRFNLVLAPVEVEIKLTVSEASKPEVDPIEYDMSGPAIRLTLLMESAGDEPVTRNQYILGLALQLLDVVHLRPRAALVSAVDDLFADGLVNKTSIGRPYEEVAGILNEGHYEALARQTDFLARAQDVPMLANRLPVPTAEGPGYVLSESLETIDRRYAVSASAVNVTLTRVTADPRYDAWISELRADGWLDWQVLMALTLIVGNQRLASRGMIPTNENRDELREVFLAAESESDILVSLDDVFGSQFKVFLQLAVVQVAHSWELRSPTQSLGHIALRELLNGRYGFATDDTPHADMLPATAAVPTHPTE